MRILFVARSNSSHQNSGGMELAYEDAARWFISKGHSVSLLTTPGEEDLAVSPAFVHIWRVTGARSGRYSAKWWRGTAMEDGPWVEWGPDVVFSVSRGAAAMRAFHERTVAQCHGTALAEVQSSFRTLTPREIAKIPVNLIRVIGEKRFYRNVGSVIAIGEAVARQLSSAPIWLESPKVQTIPNGVNPAVWRFNELERKRVRSELGVDSGASVAITVSRLHRQKGVDTAIEALALLQSSDDCHLIVCGAGPEDLPLRKLAKSLGVECKVHFLGKLPPAQVSSAMSASDVLLFPTRREEGLPLSVLEALANGLGVVTVPHAQVPESVQDWVCYASATPDGFADGWRGSSRSVDSVRLPSSLTRDLSFQHYEDLLYKIHESHFQD